MEKIDGIKIVHVEGLPGFSGQSGGSGGNGSGTAPDGGAPEHGNLADQVVNSALRYRSQAPFVDQLLGEIGLTSGSIHRTETLQDLSKIVYTDPTSASDKPARKPQTPKN
jgi:hypothetical protein